MGSSELYLDWFLTMLPSFSSDHLRRLLLLPKRKDRLFARGPGERGCKTGTHTEINSIIDYDPRPPHLLLLRVPFLTSL